MKHKVKKHLIDKGFTVNGVVSGGGVVFSANIFKRAEEFSAELTIVEIAEGFKFSCKDIVGKSSFKTHDNFKVALSSSQNLSISKQYNVLNLENIDRFIEKALDISECLKTTIYLDAIEKNGYGELYAN